MLKQFFIAIIILTTFSTNGQGQVSNLSVSSIPPTLLKDANAVVREDQMKFVVRSPEEATLEVRMAVTVFNDKTGYESLAIHFDDKAKISDFEARLYDWSGNEIRSYSKKDVKDYSAVSSYSIYEDSRVKSVEFNHSSYPYTIVYHYKKKFKGILSYPDSYVQSFHTSVQSLEYTIEVPEGMKPRYRSKNIDCDPVRTSQGDMVSYEWKLKNVPAIPKEDYAPVRDAVLPVIEVEPSLFQYEDYTGKISDWNSLGRFFYDLNDGRDVVSPEMKKEIAALTDGMKTPEKIKVLYRYLQDNMRYVSVQLGIGGWQTFDARYVEKNKYGDCKALSNFMKSMLKAIDIPAYAVVIYNDPQSKILYDPEFATPRANHNILYIPGEDIWLECTSDSYPVNYIGQGNADRPVLLITPEGGKLAHTPVYALKDNRQSSHATIIMNPDGSADIDYTCHYSGVRHEKPRYLSVNFSEKEQKDWFAKQASLPAFTSKSFGLSASPEKPEAELKTALHCYRYAAKAGKRLFVPLNQQNRFTAVPESDTNRVHPIHIKTAWQEEGTITYQLPEGYEIESLPAETLVLDSDFGKYELQITREDNKVNYKRKLERYAVQKPAGEYELFRKFWKEVAAADQVKMVLVKQ